MQVDTDVFAALTERAAAADRLAAQVTDLLRQVGTLTRRISALTGRITSLGRRVQDMARLSEIVHGREAEYGRMLARARGGRPEPRHARDRHGLRVVGGGRP